MREQSPQPADSRGDERPDHKTYDHAYQQHRKIDPSRNAAPTAVLVLHSRPDKPGSGQRGGSEPQANHVFGAIVAPRASSNHGHDFGRRDRLGLSHGLADLLPIAARKRLRGKLHDLLSL